jgi:hypothetical protein
MKKVILALSGILVAAFVIVMVANASTGAQETKKAKTEATATHDCSKCPSAATCDKTKEVTAADASAKASDAKSAPACCSKKTADTKESEAAAAKSTIKN